MFNFRLATRPGDSPAGDRRSPLKGLRVAAAALAVVLACAAVVVGPVRTLAPDLGEYSLSEGGGSAGNGAPDRTAALAAAQARPVAAPSPSPATGVIWQGNPALGPAANFQGLEEKPGTITVANDPQGRFGPSFRYETWDNKGVKSRSESRGLRQPDGSVVSLGSPEEGQTFYLGWRALWNPMPITKGKWIALFQLHVDGVGPGGLNVGPFVLRTLGDGQLHFQLISPNGSSVHIWNAPLSLNTWNSFVIGYRLSRSGAVGWVEFWYNGVQQTFTNGATRYPGATLWGDHVNTKWGVYRSGANKGHAVAYVNHAQLGRSYADVAL